MTILEGLRLTIKPNYEPNNQIIKKNSINQLRNKGNENGYFLAPRLIMLKIRICLKFLGVF